MTVLKNKQTVPLLLILMLCCSGTLTGCNRSRPQENATAPAAKPAATPTPKPTPTPLHAQAENVHFTMTNLNGQTVALMDAKTTNYDPLNGGGAITAQDADAVLYEDGKPTTHLRAKTIKADNTTRIVTATGNVRAESLSRADAPTVRADRMIWTADSKVLTGDGNVLLTMKPDYELPGHSFRADTKLNHFNVKQNKLPGRGSL